MKYQIEKLTNKIVTIYEDSFDTTEYNENIYYFMHGDKYMTLNESLEWIPDKDKINKRLSEIDREFGNRYIRDFAINNPSAVHNIAYQKIEAAEAEAANLRKLYNE